MVGVSLKKTMFSTESFPVTHEAHIVCWTPPRQPAAKRQHPAMHVNPGQTGEKTLLVKSHTNSMLVLVTCD